MTVDLKNWEIIISKFINLIGKKLINKVKQLQQYMYGYNLLMNIKR